MATTDSQGRYVIEPLPAGEYLIGVNASENSDEGEYPPVLREPVQIAEGDQLDGIDIVLKPKRKTATLRVLVTGFRGEPYSGAGVILSDLAGAQRWNSNDQVTVEGLLEIPVYVGEKYVATAFDYHHADDDPAQGFLNGTARIDITGENASVTVVLALTRSE
jgi:hypothetical protein